MSCVRIASLLVIATAIAVAAGRAAAPAAASASANQVPPILATPAVPPEPEPAATAPARPRAISPAIAAQLSAAVPKFDATAAAAKPAAERAPDLRETDKPRNTIIRLPNYVVQEEKPPVFKERELYTPRARLELALKRHPGLRFGNIWIFRNDGVALAMLAEEERLERKREFEDLVGLMRYSDPATHATAKREVEQGFMRVPDFGR